MSSPQEASSESMEGTPLADRILAELELLARNVDILERLSDNHPMGIIRLSEALKLPIHKVRYSLHLLERQGVIEPSAEGAVVTERAQEYLRDMERSLDRMAEITRHLKERSSAFKARGQGAPGPKSPPSSTRARGQG
jgi:predicted transcriptional regulator